MCLVIFLTTTNVQPGLGDFLREKKEWIKENVSKEDLIAMAVGVASAAVVGTAIIGGAYFGSKALKNLESPGKQESISIEGISDMQSMRKFLSSKGYNFDSFKEWELEKINELSENNKTVRVAKLNDNVIVMQVPVKQQAGLQCGICAYQNAIELAKKVNTDIGKLIKALGGTDGTKKLVESIKSRREGRKLAGEAGENLHDYEIQWLLSGAGEDDPAPDFDTFELDNSYRLKILRGMEKKLFEGQHINSLKGNFKEDNKDPEVLIVHTSETGGGEGHWIAIRAEDFGKDKDDNKWIGIILTDSLSINAIGTYKDFFINFASFLREDSSTEEEE